MTNNDILGLLVCTYINFLTIIFIILILIFPHYKQKYANETLFAINERKIKFPKNVIKILDDRKLVYIGLSILIFDLLISIIFTTLALQNVIITNNIIENYIFITTAISVIGNLTYAISWVFYDKGEEILSLIKDNQNEATIDYIVHISTKSSYANNLNIINDFKSNKNRLIKTIIKSKIIKQEFTYQDLIVKFSKLHGKKRLLEIECFCLDSAIDPFEINNLKLNNIQVSYLRELLIKDLNIKEIQ
ncbi:hypothetical protein [Metamycoplasma equirhinis]|uniref:hypothetical protein n=1 Tax=Metamycoplasma equirhinis TaxID=92402 RepID=UPI003592F3BD